jgi:hypothetical protein
MSVRTGRLNIIILFWKYQFHCWEYINGNQTFILDSHQPDIYIGFSPAHFCSATPNPKLRLYHPISKPLTSEKGAEEGVT